MEVDCLEQTLYQRGTTLVRRLFLAPGEATRWHRDLFHRLTIIFTGEVLAIEFRDGSPCQHVRVTPGQVYWEEPSERIHRAIKRIFEPFYTTKDLNGTSLGLLISAGIVERHKGALTFAAPPTPSTRNHLLPPPPHGRKPSSFTP